MPENEKTEIVTPVAEVKLAAAPAESLPEPRLTPEVWWRERQIWAAVPWMTIKKGDIFRLRRLTDGRIQQEQLKDGPLVSVYVACAEAEKAPPPAYHAVKCEPVIAFDDSPS